MTGCAWSAATRFYRGVVIGLGFALRGFHQPVTAMAFSVQPPEQRNGARDRAGDGVIARLQATHRPLRRRAPAERQGHLASGEAQRFALGLESGGGHLAVSRHYRRPPGESVGNLVRRILTDEIEPDARHFGERPVIVGGRRKAAAYLAVRVHGAVVVDGHRIGDRAKAMRYGPARIVWVNTAVTRLCSKKTPGGGRGQF